MAIPWGDVSGCCRHGWKIGVFCDQCTAALTPQADELGELRELVHAQAQRLAELEGSPLEDAFPEDLLPEDDHQARAKRLRGELRGEVDVQFKAIREQLFREEG